MVSEQDNEPGGPAGSRVEHRPEAHRFVLVHGDDEPSHLEYVVRGDQWVITHTYTEPSARGSGLAADVTRVALDTARAQGVGVRIVCPFVADFVAAHPEYADLVESR